MLIFDSLISIFLCICNGMKKNKLTPNLYYPTCVFWTPNSEILAKALHWPLKIWVKSDWDAWFSISIYVVLKKIFFFLSFFLFFLLMSSPPFFSSCHGLLFWFTALIHVGDEYIVTYWKSRGYFICLRVILKLWGAKHPYFLDAVFHTASYDQNLALYKWEKKNICGDYFSHWLNLQNKLLHCSLWEFSGALFWFFMLL